MGGCLKNLVIAATGDFGPGKGPEQIRKWVDANGGRWSPRVKDGITHLIADKGAWKKNVDAGMLKNPLHSDTKRGVLSSYPRDRV